MFYFSLCSVDIILHSDPHIHLFIKCTVKLTVFSLDSYIYIFVSCSIIGKCHTDKHLTPLPEVQEHFRARIERRRNKVKK